MPAKTTFGCQKNIWQPKVVLAFATCRIRKNHIETKKFGSQIWFWQKIAKSRFGNQFFLVLDSFLACDICLHD
jgi:hypothetical protein